MATLWSLNADGHSYDLCLDVDSHWVIKQDLMKVILRYNEDTKMWMGVKSGKIVKLPWPTFRDIVNQYLVQ